MKEYPSTAITRLSGEILETARRAPVAITRYRKRAFVIMSTEHYEQLAGPDTRSVETAATVSDVMRAEMLAAIDAELGDG